MAFRLSIALALLVCTTACDPDQAVDRDALGHARAPIINGHACDAEEEPETVALIVDASLRYEGQDYPLRALLCTGTLIAPDVVLTAAHCVDPDALTLGFAELIDPTYYVSTEADLTSLAATSQELPELPADAAPAARVVHHADFDLGAPIGEGLGDFRDIGLVFLDAPLARPFALVATPAEAAELAVGREVTIAGWGQTSPDDEETGIKQCATTAIHELGDHEMQIGNEPATSRKCHGDSGGPTFAALAGGRRVIGVTSRAYDERDCELGGVDTRADAWYAWLDEQMRAGCADDSRSWCEVEGVITPEDVATDDEDDDGGCSAAGGGPSMLAACAVALALWRRRRARI